MRQFTLLLFFVFGLTLLGSNVCFGQQEDLRQRLLELQTAMSNQASLGEYKNAVKIASKIMETVPDDFRLYVLRGELNYMAGDMKASVSDFDQAILIQPDAEPQLWQRGLALYYLDRFQDGADQFESHRTVNGQDVENAVWHFACVAKASSFDDARKQLMPIQRDPRAPMMQIHQLYAGKMTPDQVLAAAREGLDPDSNEAARNEFYANFYIGLYFEAKGEQDEAMKYMKRSIAKDNSIPKQSLMSQVGHVHLMMRKSADND